ncbi:hypothetical protein D3C86_1877230 [compost metagenome]
MDGWRQSSAVAANSLRHDPVSKYAGKQAVRLIPPAGLAANRIACKLAQSPRRRPAKRDNPPAPFQRSNAVLPVGVQYRPARM